MACAWDANVKTEWSGALCQMRDLLIDRLGEIRHHIAGVLGRSRLDEHHPRLFGCPRPMLDTARHDMEVARLQHHLAIAIAHGKRAAMHQEELVLVGMRMEWELAFELGELEILAIRYRDNPRREVLGDGVELVDKMAGVGHGRFLPLHRNMERARRVS